MFQGYDRAVLDGFSNLLSSGGKAREIGIVLPSTVMAALWQAAVPVWLSGHVAVVKPSRREPFFAQLLWESSKPWRTHLPMRLMSGSHESVRKKLAACEAVIAYGSDGTLASFPLSGVIRFGTRVSAACVEGRHLSPGHRVAMADSLAHDIVLYETQGCLSPQWVFVRGSSRDVSSMADALSLAMTRLDRVFPRMNPRRDDLESESFWQKWEFRQSRGQARVFRRNTVLHAASTLESTGVRRAVQVVPISNMAEIPRRLGPWWKRLSTLAIAGTEMLKLPEVFQTRSDVRICDVGWMHRPPPDWKNGGVDLFRILS